MNPLKHRYAEGYLTLEAQKKDGQECAPCINSLSWQGVKPDDAKAKAAHKQAIDDDKTGEKLETHRDWKNKWIEAKNKKVELSGPNGRVTAHDMGMVRNVVLSNDQIVQAEGVIGWVWSEARFKERFNKPPDYRVYEKRTATFGGRTIVGPMLGPECEDTEKNLAVKIMGVGRVKVSDSMTVGSSETSDGATLDKTMAATVAEVLTGNAMASDGSASTDLTATPNIDPVCFANAAAAPSAAAAPASARVPTPVAAPTAFPQALAPTTVPAGAPIVLGPVPATAPGPQEPPITPVVKKQRRGTTASGEKDERAKKLKAEDVQLLLQKVESAVNDLTGKAELFSLSSNIPVKDLESTTKTLTDLLSFKNYRSFHSPDLQGRYNGDDLYTRGTRVWSSGKVIINLLKCYLASKKYKFKGVAAPVTMKTEVKDATTTSKANPKNADAALQDGSAKAFAMNLIQGSEHSLIVNGDILKAAVRQSALECMSADL